MLNFSLKQLEVFVAIVETGSFTKAANRLYMAQSTVSAHIRTLESELGVLLFLRNSKRKLQVTEVGRRIYNSACGILERCHSLEDEILIDKSNELCIGASTVPAACLLPQYIPGFSYLHPEARFSIKEGDSSSIHRALMEGDVQVGLVGSFVKHQSLKYEEIAQDDIVLITPAREPYLTKQKEGALGKEFLSHPLLFREAGSGTQRVIDDYFSKIGLEKNKLNIIGRFESSDGIIKMVSRGLGLALISRLLVEPYVKDGMVLQFSLEKDPGAVARSYYLVSRKNADNSGLTQKFIDYIKAASKAGKAGSKQAGKSTNKLVAQSSGKTTPKLAGQ